MPRYAAIDIGTNSVKITVADVQQGSIAGIVAERSKITRLGKSVDKTRRFEAPAVAATLQAIREFSDEARALGAERIVAGGTSAMRDAHNGDEFRQRASEITGGEIELITGKREAELTFLGAMSDAALARSANDGGHLLAFDVGGGSTELIAGQGAPSPKIDHSQSLDIGAVRLTERCFRSESPKPDELDRAQGIVDGLLKSFEARFEISRIVGIGGTAVNAASILKNEKNANQPQESGGVDVQGLVINASDLDALTTRLAALTLEKRKSIPGLDPGRADVIVAGLLIIGRILAQFGLSSLTVSARGVRHGLLLELAA